MKCSEEQRAACRTGEEAGGTSAARTQTEGEDTERDSRQWLHGQTSVAEDSEEEFRTGSVRDGRMVWLTDFLHCQKPKRGGL